MVEVGLEKGVIQTTEKEMINNIFEFDNTKEIKEVERIDNRTFIVEGMVGLGLVNELGTPL